MQFYLKKVISVGLLSRIYVVAGLLLLRVAVVAISGLLPCVVIIVFIRRLLQAVVITGIRRLFCIVVEAVASLLMSVVV
jgi:hypothetical protein